MSARARLMSYTAAWFTAKNLAVMAALVAIGGGVVLTLDRTSTSRQAEEATFPANPAQPGQDPTATTLPPPPVDAPASATPGDLLAPPTSATIGPPAVATPVPEARLRDVRSAVNTPRSSEVVDKARRVVRGTVSQASTNVRSAVVKPVTVPVVPAVEVRRPTSPPVSQPTNTKPPAVVILNPYDALNLGASLEQVRTLLNQNGRLLTVSGDGSNTVYIWNGNYSQQIVSVFNGNNLVAKSQFG